MLLKQADGSVFATGATRRRYKKAPYDMMERIHLQVNVESLAMEAIFDTGAPYVICPPRFMNWLGLDKDDACDNREALIIIFII